MRHRAKRIAAQVGGGVAAIVGANGLFITFKRAVAHTLTEPASEVILAGGLVVLGVSAIFYSGSTHLRWTRATFGAVFILAGIYAIAGMVDHGLPRDGVSALVAVAAAVALAVGGVLLLRSARIAGENSRSGDGAI